MLHTIKKAEYIEEYKVKLLFSDGSVKIVNLEKMLNKAKNMLLPLIELDYFKLVKCDGTTIFWPNGVDLCPDVLYKIGKTITKAKRKQNTNSPKLRKRTRTKSLA